MIEAILEEWDKIRPETIKTEPTSRAADTAINISTGGSCATQIRSRGSYWKTVLRSTDQHPATACVHLGQIWREREWAIVKLQELQLVFVMGLSRREPDPSTLVNDSNPSETSTPLLDSLYHRIANLRQLRILDLRISMAGKVDPVSDENYVRYKEKTVPGLLVLEDQVAHRRGWLQLFSRLDQLDELHGLFNVDKVQHGFEFGELEADWIVEH
ncbi:hypothetical protein F5H01DRAFT_321904 [Linnemannia elongata]|nr:hypothetical protein F5H01DRAFT_321904 [Linnemannia elongata]